MLLMSKLLLSYFYVTFKQWLQEVKIPYFSFIRLNPIFYNMYIAYSKKHFIILFYFFKFLQSKVQIIKQWLWLLLVYVSVTIATT